MSTVELQLDNDYNDFFILPVRQFWQVVVLGVVLGVLLAIAFPVIAYVSCNYFESICQLNSVVVTRISLIVLSIIGLVAMIRFGVQRAIMVALAYLAVMWFFQIDYGTNVLWRVLVYVVMSAVILSLFHWLSGLRSWVLSLVLTVVSLVVVLLALL